MKGSSCKIDVSCFDLRHTFESAQPLTFHADYSVNGNSLVYASGKSLIHISVPPDGNSINVASNNMDEAVNDVHRRFRLDDDMGYIYKKIDTDEHIGNSINRYRGMRLTVNDPWETTLCFIISQFNNVKRIRLIVRNIVGNYGRDVLDDNGKVVAKSFPNSEDLVGGPVKEIFACGTGFRAKYIAHAAEYCTNNLDLYKLNPNNYERLKEELMEIDGVGEKVADCIALMGYGNLNSFPIDVHIKRAMERLYFNGRAKRIKEIHELSKEMWGSYRGYAQQYLFHKSRMDGVKT